MLKLETCRGNQICVYRDVIQSPPSTPVGSSVYSIYIVCMLDTLSTVVFYLGAFIGAYMNVYLYILYSDACVYIKHCSSSLLIGILFCGICHLYFMFVIYATGHKTKNELNLVMQRLKETSTQLIQWGKI